MRYLCVKMRIIERRAPAIERMELYCNAHPGSPSAVRRPHLSVRGELWIALLGSSVEEGIVGIGPSVEAALCAFDAQYLAALSPPGRAAGSRRALSVHRQVAQLKFNRGFRAAV
jgi:hypothetical protein